MEPIEVTKAVRCEELLAKKRAQRKSVGAGWNSGEIQPMQQRCQRTSRRRELPQQQAESKNQREDPPSLHHDARVIMTNVQRHNACREVGQNLHLKALMSCMLFSRENVGEFRGRKGETRCPRSKREVGNAFA